MRTLNNIGILLVIAALALVPQALAMQFSFGGSAGSTGGIISPGVYYGEHSVLGGDLFTSEGAYGTGITFNDIDKWWRFHSTGDGSKENVYMYAKLTGDGIYTVSGTQGATSATGKLSVTATTPVYEINLGGWAENPTMYAAVNVNADYAKTLKYTNTLSASSSKVSASQTFDGTDVVDFEAGAWAVNGLFDTAIPLEGPISPIFAETNPSLAAGQFAEIGSGTTSAITGYKSGASVDAKTATSSQSATSITSADDAEFFGFSWQSALDEYDYPAFNGAKTLADVDGSSSMAYSANSKATSAGTATATQTLSAVNAYDFDARTWAASGELEGWSLENVVDSWDMIDWDDVDMAAAQFASVDGDGDVFNVKSYTATASVAASGASSSQSANLPTSAGNWYDAEFCGFAKQIDWDEYTAVEAQAGAAIDDARNLVYNSNNKVTSKGAASAGQTFSATDAEWIETTDIVSSESEDSFIGAAQIADVSASEDDDSFGVKSFTGSASFDGKVAKASQSFTEATGSDDVDATFAGGALNVIDEDNFAGAATASLVDEGQSVAYSAASSSDASASQTLTTKEADAIIQIALAFTQTEDNFDYAGSLVGAGAVYPIINPEEPAELQEVEGIFGESESAVTSYSATDRVSSKTDKSGKITTTATNTLDAKGGFIGRVIAAGEGNALSYSDIDLPLTLNHEVNTELLMTFTENIIPVANRWGDGVGVVGETLVFAPVLSNNPDGCPIVVDRETDKPNKNSLKGSATATVTNNGVSTTSTLSGSWKITAQKDTTPVGEYVPHDLNSVERFAYASNGDYDDDAYAMQGTETRAGAATFSYTEKAKETVTAYPTASV